MGQIKCYNIKLHNSLPKEVTIDDDVKLEIDEIIVNAISDQTGWLVEGFNWKVEEEQRPTESDNTLDQFFVNE